MQLPFCWLRLNSPVFSWPSRFLSNPLRSVGYHTGLLLSLSSILPMAKLRLGQLEARSPRDQADCVSLPPASWISSFCPPRRHQGLTLALVGVGLNRFDPLLHHSTIPFWYFRLDWFSLRLNELAVGLGKPRARPRKASGPGLFGGNKPWGSFTPSAQAFGIAIGISHPVI